MKQLSETLNMSKIEQGEVRIKQTVFSMSDLLMPVAIAANSNSLSKHIDFIFSISATFPRLVYGESQMFLQVVNNLLSNALKFTKEGYVRVELSFKEETVILKVEDSGMGMSQDQQKIIFSRFIQADPSIARIAGGTGLGLSLVQEIVSLLKGTIQFDSVLNKGTFFEVHIPMESYYENCPRPFLDNKDHKIIVIDGNYNKDKQMLDFLGYHGFKGIWFNDINQCPNYKNDSLIHAVIIDSIIYTENKDKLRDLFSKTISFCAILDPGFSTELNLFLTRPLMPEPIRQFLEGIRFGHHSNQILVIKNEIATGTRVLVVEDNKTNQMVMEKMLKRLECKCSIANNGIEAIKKLEESIFDIIFMDCQMPEMDGIEATKYIRASRKDYQSIPIIALTASVVEGDEENCIAAGMNSYLAKPVRMQQVTDIIQQYVNQ